MKWVLPLSLWKEKQPYQHFDFIASKTLVRLKPTDYIFLSHYEFVLIYYASKTNEYNMLVLRFFFNV